MDLDEVVRDLAPRLLRYATGRMGSLSLAEDVAQHALTALVQRWRRTGPPESPEAFVFAIARRRAARALFRRRLLVPLQAIAVRPARTSDPEALAVASENGHLLRVCLARLDRLDREALLLVAASGLRSADAATLLGISESAVRMRVLRARRRLASLLEDPHGPRR
ncbi:MAG: RNA polymerase sigma factor [Bacteroidales bacterium]